MISATVFADSVRASIPCSLLSASMVPFATLSLGIGAVSWVVPKKTFLALDNTLYRAYMRLCLFVFENVSAVQLKLHGDVEALRQKPEKALILSNHQSNVDWAVIMMLAARQGEKGSDAGFRVMVKNAIHYVPLFGWYIFQHGYIYVRRFGGFVSDPVLRQLRWLNDIDEPFWLLIFPEGTRFSYKHGKKIKESQEFCEKQGKPVLNNVLCPRAGGAELVLRNLDCDAIYDVTIAYGQTLNDGKRGYAPGMFDFVCGPFINRTLSVHIRRFPVADVPKEGDELRKWMFERYLEKDRMLESFHSTGELPDLVSNTEKAISISRTLPPTLFFSAALIAPVFSPLVRKAYKYTIYSFPLLIIWLKIRKCV